MAHWKEAVSYVVAKSMQLTEVSPGKKNLKCHKYVKPLHRKVIFNVYHS